MTSLRTGLLIATVLLGSLVPSSAFATAVSGGASITGNVTVTATAVDFTSLNPGPASGSYTPFTSGTIGSLTGGPATGAVSFPKFVVFNGPTPGPVYYDLTTIFPGTGTNAACLTNTIGNVCTPTGSPFTLTQNATGVTVFLSTQGIAYTGSSSTGSSPTNATFTTQIAGTLSSVLAQVASGGLTTTYSGTFTSFPPPPPFTGCTVTQGGWGAAPHGNNPGAFLYAHFPSGGVVIGGLNTLTFTTPQAITNFLPQGGPPSFLNSSATNPTTSSAGVFAGQVLALELNVLLNNYGSVIITGTGTPFDGKTVAMFLAAANVALGNGSLPAGISSISQLNDLADFLNSQFDNCASLS